MNQKIDDGSAADLLKKINEKLGCKIATGEDALSLIYEVLIPALQREYNAGINYFLIKQQHLQSDINKQMKAVNGRINTAIEVNKRNAKDCL